MSFLNDLPVYQLGRMARAAATQAGRERFIRRTAYRAIGRISPAVAVSKNDSMYFLPTRDGLLGEPTFVQGGFEQLALAAAVRLAGPISGKVFVDVGANIGTTTIPAVTMYGASRALALEPADLNVRYLRCNLIFNDLEAVVTVVKAAASSEPGTSVLEHNPGSIGDYSLRPAGERRGSRGEAQWPTEPVCVTTVDAAATANDVKPARVGMLWVDTQGHDPAVLEGAKSFFGSVPIVVEYWPYGLRRQGLLDRFHQQLFDGAVELVDLGTGQEVRTPESLVSSYSSEMVHTNLLLLPS